MEQTLAIPFHNGNTNSVEFNDAYELKINYKRINK